MPLLFSYGSLQEEEVQRSTLGRRLDGQRDELLQFEKSRDKIAGVYANVKFTGDGESRVPGMVFEVTDAELARIDEYELRFGYERVVAMLASGKETWVYAHAGLRN